MTTTTRTTALAALRTASQQTWDGCTATAGITDCGAGHDQAKEDKAEADAASAIDAWDTAIECVEAGDRDGALEALETARALAAEWGEDGHEREAIELVKAGAYSEHWMVLVAEADESAVTDFGGSPAIELDSNSAGGVTDYLSLDDDGAVWYNGEGIRYEVEGEPSLAEIIAANEEDPSAE